MKMPFFLNLIFYFVALSSTEIPVTLEHAVSPEELAQGLMERDFLAPNQGMTFTFSPPRQVTIWMYNTKIDLDVAFLDEQKTIREIHHLKAYPHMTDPHFFVPKSVTAAFPTSYVLEMNAGWFENNNVSPGAKVFWNGDSPRGAIIPAGAIIRP